jgi:hypothetical protein
MMKKRFCAASALALGLVWFGAGPVAASTQTSATNKAAKEDTSRRVCKNLVLSGSRLTTRFCRSQEEWDRDEEKAQRDQLESRFNHSSRDGEMNKPR